ncbi:hypothetical protein B0H63DRAFT_158683 [Podospora didyma]|uniref:Biogenesis of lysosome-related organelles complex 1 subunit 1 n=1 Tax=Podospora didyma TaxID=330526 RepID=A0AAE0NTL3_9PEZI|nr:hypothetical protein B0H63DRAFT_158683 [Podospora didyma]
MPSSSSAATATATTIVTPPQPSPPSVTSSTATASASSITTTVTTTTTTTTTPAAAAVDSGSSSGSSSRPSASTSASGPTAPSSISSAAGGGQALFPLHHATSSTTNNTTGPAAGIIINPSLPSPSTQRQIEEARTAVVASLGNMLDRELAGRGALLHVNNTAIERQERDVGKALAGLRKENDKLAKMVGEQTKKVKEIGNVQNWAEMLEREFLIIEETLRLVEHGDEEEDGENGDVVMEHGGGDETGQEPVVVVVDKGKGVEAVDGQVASGSALAAAVSSSSSDDDVKLLAPELVPLPASLGDEELQLL